MGEKSEQKFPICDERAKTSLLSTLFAHWIHQNTLMYSRSNVVLALQGAGFTAGWIGGHIWGGITLLFTGFITICLKQMIDRDWECRDANLELMKKLEDDLMPDDCWIPKGDSKENIFPRKIRVGVPRDNTWKSAGLVYNRSITILIWADFACAILTFFGYFGKS